MTGLDEAFRQLGQIMAREDRERAFRFQEMQEQRERSRKEGMTGKVSYTDIINTAPGKAQGIYTRLQAKLTEIAADHRLPEAGKLIESQTARDEAVEKLENLAAKVEIAGVMQKNELEKQKKESRPKIDEADRARTERYLILLNERGVPVSELIERARGSVEGLTVLQDGLAATLAQAENPMDRDAAQGLVELLDAYALEDGLFGDDYRAAHEQLQKADDQTQLALYNVNTAAAAARGHDSNPIFTDTSGNVVDSPDAA